MNPELLHAVVFLPKGTFHTTTMSAFIRESQRSLKSGVPMLTVLVGLYECEEQAFLAADIANIAGSIASQEVGHLLEDWSKP